MTTVREGLEQAVLMSIGAAALTRERAEAGRRRAGAQGPGWAARRARPSWSA